MNNQFLLNMKVLERIKDRWNQYVWEIFNKYIEENRINFNGPDSWEVDGKNIHFEGTDGCRGCYDPMNLDIPIKYFLDYDAAIAEKKEKELAERAKQEVLRIAQLAANQKVTEAREKEELKRLQAKYGKDLK